MRWRLMADAIALFHGLVVVWVILGPLPSWRHPRIRLIHIVSLWWIYFVLSFQIYCPMTHIENAFRANYDPSTTYSNSFLLHYFTPMLQWNLTIPKIAAVMNGWTVLWTAIYAWRWRGEWKRRKASRSR